MDAVFERARNIRLLVLDVDGVLTDGRLYLSAAGEELKVFHVRDGSGLVAVQRAGITVAIISGRDSAAVTRRAAELGIRHVRQGVADKGAALDQLLEELGVSAAATLRNGRCVVASATRRPPPASSITGRRVPVRRARNSVCPVNGIPASLMTDFCTGAVTIA